MGLYSTSKPVDASRFAFFVAPGVVAYIYPLIFFNPPAADVTVIFLEFLEKRFSIVECFLFPGH